MPLAPNALTTVRRIKKQLGLPVEDDPNIDEDIEDLINAASDYIETFCDRKFGKASYTERLAGNWRLKLMLNQYPILSVESVIVDDRELKSEEYELLREEGMLYKDDGWPGKVFGNQNLSFTVTELKLNIKVQYTAGYVLPKDGTTEEPRTLPWDIEQACVKLATLYYNDNGGVAGILALKREVIGDWQGEYQVVNPINDGFEKVPYDVIQTLLKWRRKA